MDDLNFNLIKCIRQQIMQGGSKTALKHKIAESWHETSWEQFGNTIDQLSQTLLIKNIKLQDKVGIFSPNMPNWSIADLAIIQIRAISVPIYDTSSLEQLHYITQNADIKILFVGAQEQFDLALEIYESCEQLKYIVAMDPCINTGSYNYTFTWQDFLDIANFAPNKENINKELDSRIAQIQFDDLFTLIYTSGTTGQPKGVMLDHNNLASQLKAHNQKLNLTSQDISLCFLPLAHVFERAWSFYVLYKGGVNCYLQDTNQIKEALTEIRPTVMCAVPRFYEKIFSAIHEKISDAPIYRKIIFTLAVNMGARLAACTQKQRKPSWLLKRLYKIADKMVLSKLREILGGKIKFMPCGGAKLDPSIGRFFHAIGINVKLGYGMTETTATVSCWDDYHFNPASIGVAMPGAQVKIGQDHEILVRGPMVMRGYYKMPEETIKSFDEYGFLKTGDAGYIDKYGNLFITDRIKELMKTSGGKYIAPQLVEGTIGKDHFIEQIAIIADTRKFVSALIVPCFDSLEAYAQKINITYKNRVELIKHNQIVEMLETRINDLQKGLAKFEQVKKFKLLPKSFSMNNGELTPTQKLRRKVINDKYHKEIEDMYQDKECK